MARGRGWHIYEGTFYVAEGGELEGGRILRFPMDGRKTVLVQDLPTRGDHHTNGPAIGPDGYLYFGVGTFTNSGVVGEDNAEFGWLKRFPKLHDIPCKDIRLLGASFGSGDPLNAGAGEQVQTGAFSECQPRCARTRATADEQITSAERSLEHFQVRPR